MIVTFPFPSNINYADELLNEFVKDFETVYEKQYISQNVDNLLHLCSDVRKFGSLDKFSAFRFENYMSSIKKIIRKGEKPFQQIARRYAEQEKAEMETAEISNNSSCEKENLKQQHYSGPLTTEIPYSDNRFKIYESGTYTINCNYSK